MKFNGTEYTIKDNNLAINQASIPLLIKYRKLQAEYLDDIDTSIIDKYEHRISELKNAINDLSKLNESDIFEGEQTNGNKLIELRERLKEIEDLKASDEELQIISKMKNDIEALILTELSLDTALMSKLFSKILIGDTSKIDYEHSDYRLFAMEVLANFFTVLQLSKNGLQN